MFGFFFWWSECAEPFSACGTGKIAISSLFCHYPVPLVFFFLSVWSRFGWNAAWARFTFRNIFLWALSFFNLGFAARTYRMRFLFNHFFLGILSSVFSCVTWAACFFKSVKFTHTRATFNHAIIICYHTIFFFVGNRKCSNFLNISMNVL